MKCIEVQERLKEFIAASLDYSDKEGITEHLASCEECREKEKFFRTEGKIFLEASEFDVPQDLYERIAEEIEKPQTRRAKFSLSKISNAFNRTISWRLAASFIVMFILGLMVGAWGISIPNNDIYKELAEDKIKLATLLGNYEAKLKINESKLNSLETQIARLTGSSAGMNNRPYQVRLIDKDNNLVEEKIFNSQEDLEKFLSKIYESYYLNPKGAPEPPAATVSYE